MNSLLEYPERIVLKLLNVASTMSQDYIDVLRPEITFIVFENLGLDEKTK
jgi:hypothetical protein